MSRINLKIVPNANSIMVFGQSIYADATKIVNLDPSSSDYQNCKQEILNAANEIQNDLNSLREILG